MSSIRILLVEDDELFRLGLSTRLQREPGLEIVGEAIDGESAIELATSLPIDIVILDIGLPGIGGLSACREIKSLRPDLPILVLTSHSQPQLIADLIAAGVQGYCLKGIPAESLILAIRSIVAGASWWDETSSRQISAVFGSQTTKPHPRSTFPSDNPLTTREQEILALVGAGKSNQEIAQTLYITSGTVRVHVHTILNKLNVRDRTQAAILAIQQGLVDPHLLNPE